MAQGRIELGIFHAHAPGVSENSLTGKRMFHVISFPHRGYILSLSTVTVNIWTKSAKAPSRDRSVAVF